MNYNFPDPHAVVDLFILNRQDIRLNNAVNKGVSKAIRGQYRRSTTIKEIKIYLANFYQVYTKDFSLTQCPMANHGQLSSNNLMAFADNACLGDLFYATHSTCRTMPYNFGIQWK